MIVFNFIEIEGYKSIPGPLHYPLNTRGISVLMGKNGAGKTSIIDALVWVLKGKTIKKVIDPSPWQSSRGDNYKGTRVRLNITVGGKNIDIYRHKAYKGETWGIKGDNHILITGGKSIRDKVDIQKAIDKLVPLSFDLLKSSVIFGQKLKKLLEQPGVGRKDILEEIFEVFYIEKAKEVVKGVLESLDSQWASLSAKKDRYELDIETIGGKIKSELAYQERWLKENNANINRLSSELHEAQHQLSVLPPVDLVKRLEFPKTITTLQTRKAEITAQYNNLNYSLKIHRDKLGELQSYKVGKRCPTCGTLLKKGKPKHPMVDPIKKCKEQISSIEYSLKELNSPRKDIDKALEVAQRKWELAKKSNDKEFLALKLQNDKRTGLIEREKILTQNLEKARGNKYKPLVDVHSLKIKKSELGKQLKKCKAQLDTLKTQREEYQWVSKVPLSHTGIKAFVINYMLKQLNTQLDLYTRDFGMSIRVGIKMETKMKDFYARIYKGDVERDYYELSGGEQQLVDIFISFSIHDITTESRDINILCLDEVFESLDPINVQKVSELISKKSQTKSIHLITHLTNLQFSGPVTYYKVRNKEGRTSIS